MFNIFQAFDWSVCNFKQNKPSKSNNISNPSTLVCSLSSLRLVVTREVITRKLLLLSSIGNEDHIYFSDDTMIAEIHK